MIPISRRLATLPEFTRQTQQRSARAKVESSLETKKSKYTNHSCEVVIFASKFNQSVYLCATDGAIENERVPHHLDMLSSEKLTLYILLDPGGNVQRSIHHPFFFPIPTVPTCLTYKLRSRSTTFLCHIANELKQNKTKNAFNFDITSKIKMHQAFLFFVLKLKSMTLFY